LAITGGALLASKDLLFARLSGAHEVVPEAGG
jgi:hypothetical protein